ncbi:DUF6708 domain-containing protein [Lysobacter capsici]|uniref:DUF6708 domain-containing protein n=1 Tax=Lysobacter capsici TaxID=435897 RepID=UPI00287B88BF|nr:DUF6708 domain-containing protein [Lysobacter capsici]WND83079.1 hypothetical protein RJ610_12315 [Lysobacter capsici]WND88278.1 hypothetical protein RJ609_12325 [Lysobacter capsici]
MSLPLPFQYLPEKNGLWGVVLPTLKEPADARADPGRQVSEINPAWLQFVRTERIGWRGVGWLAGAGGGLMAALMFGPLIWSFLHAGPRLGMTVAASMVTILTLPSLIGAFFAYRARMLALPPPVILSRRLRRFYQWRDKREGWVSVDADAAVALIHASAAATQVGGDMGYRLHVVELEPGSRKIMKQVAVSEVANDPDELARLWEFLRRYIDDKPDTLPPVSYHPRLVGKYGWLARFDHDLFKNLVCEDHRLVAGRFNALRFYFAAMLEYWYVRCAAWIERDASVPEYPDDLTLAMHWEGDNPYPVKLASQEQVAAARGELAHFVRRWRIAAALSSLLYGGIFVGMVSIGWLVFT